MSEDDAERAIIRPMCAMYPPPRHLRAYRRALARFDRPVLEQAWQKVVERNPLWCWPKLAEIVQAAEQCHRQARPSADDWVEKADEMADAYTRKFLKASAHAARAREGGYEVALRRYVRAAAYVQAQYLLGRESVGYESAVLFGGGRVRDRGQEEEFFRRAKEQAEKGHLRVHVPPGLAERWGRGGGARAPEVGRQRGTRDPPRAACLSRATALGCRPVPAEGRNMTGKHWSQQVQEDDLKRGEKSVGGVADDVRPAMATERGKKAGYRLNRPASLYLDLIRPVAAAVVLLSHVSFQAISGGRLRAFGPAWPQAVDVFFVLSGFVIAHVCATRERDALTYLISRAARIYSVAIPALVLTALLDGVGMMVNPGPYRGAFQVFTPGLLARCLTFTGEKWNAHRFPGTDGAYWSLGFEVWYHAAFAAFLFVPRRWRWAAPAAVLAFIGPKVAVLFPAWLMGVATYRVCVTRRLTRGPGGRCWPCRSSRWPATKRRLTRRRPRSRRCRWNGTGP
jgi:hypothetical protein